MKRSAVIVTIAAVFAVKSSDADSLARTTIVDDASLRDRCGGVDGGLDKVARLLASRRIAGLPALGQGALTNALRDAGAPYVWPRAWVASAADERSVTSSLTSWMDAEKKSGVRRCGVARGRDKSGALVVAAVQVDALADLAPLAMHSHVGSWLTVDAHLLVAATDARVVLIEPDGSTRRLLASYSNERALARFAPDRSGVFTMQVVADVEGGPRPVLEARIVADSAAIAEDAGESVNDSACSSTNDTAAIACRIQLFRTENRLDPLVRDARLDALAIAHAGRMMAVGNLAHDAGDGDPVARLDAAGLTARAVGENVAHAESVLGAHRSLYASPSHRDNLLSREFDRFGVAVVTDADGSVWVVEELAAGLR